MDFLAFWKHYTGCYINHSGTPSVWKELHADSLQTLYNVWVHWQGFIKYPLQTVLQNMTYKNILLWIIIYVICANYIYEYVLFQKLNCWTHSVYCSAKWRSNIQGKQQYAKHIFECTVPDGWSLNRVSRSQLHIWQQQLQESCTLLHSLPVIRVIGEDKLFSYMIHEYPWLNHKRIT